MDNYQDLANVIRQAIADAWSEGLDHTGQTNAAIRKVMEVRRDIGSSEALVLVERVQAEKDA
jgi:hypothetical protein